MTARAKSPADLPALQQSGGPAWPLSPQRAVAVLMSGGVDSTATAILLQRAGWEVAGVTMAIPRLDDGADPRGHDAVADAAAVCEALGAAHFRAGTTAAFRRLVIEPFRAAYRAGRTPNPCCTCNADLKLGLLWEAIRAATGVPRLATGHYARLCGGLEPARPGARPRTTAPRLCRAREEGRDQTYFLYGVERRRLADLLLPLGSRRKEEVRALLAGAGVAVPADRPDSMELCFLGAADYRAAFAGEPDRPGPILDPDGREIGRHRGIRHYTVGQRRGLGQSFGPEPVYVLAIRPERNALVVGPRAAGRRRRVRATALRALQPERLEPGARLRGMVRSRSDLEACTLLAAGDEELAVDFDEPRFAVAPGQRLVLYDRDDCVVAGGEIMPSPA